MIILGDTHGIRPIFNIIDKKKITDSNIIHVGDIGIGFEEIQRDVKNLLLLDEMLLDTNNQLFVIRGNHDFKIFWDKSMGLHLPKFHNLHLVEDNSILKIEDKNVFFAGGAISIDRITRKRDIQYPSWDEYEEFIFEPTVIKKIMDEFIKKESFLDLVITHTAPNFCAPISDNVAIVNDWARVEQMHGNDLKTCLKAERYEVKQLHDLLKQYVPIIDWVYGHFHKSYHTYFDNTNFYGLTINELRVII